MHIEYFPEGITLRKMKNTHYGKRCFIIGNGPSLSSNDLDRIHKNGDISFAFNRIFNIFPLTHWRPTYYISQDEKMLAGCVDEVSRMDIDYKFIPIEMKWYFGLYISRSIPFHLQIRECCNLPDFSNNISKEIIAGETVVYTAIQIAVYMGIREIYLIGIDHHFHISMNDKGEIIVDPTVKDYFCDNYNADKDNLYIPNTDKSTLTFVAAKRYADAHDIKIYNATRGGKLEVFERRDFDTLFK